MTTSFPASLDTFPSEVTLAANTLGTSPYQHSTLHDNLGDTLVAIETKLGADSSTVNTSVDYWLKSSVTKTNVNWTISETYTWVSTGASNRTGTLPSAITSTGRCLVIKKIDNGAGVVVITGTHTIDGAASYTLVAQWQSVTLVSNGSVWYVI